MAILDPMAAIIVDGNQMTQAKASTRFLASSVQCRKFVETALFVRIVVPLAVCRVFYFNSSQQLPQQRPFTSAAGYYSGGLWNSIIPARNFKSRTDLICEINPFL